MILTPDLQTVPWLWCSDTPAVSADGKWRPKHGGKLFLKELAKVGQFVKPYGAADRSDQHFRFDADLLNQFSSGFNKMDKVGVKVPIPSEHSFDPERNRGYLNDMFTDGDSLMGVLELTADNADQLAKSTDISIWAVPVWRDALGNEYRNVIRHVALTTYPVLPGLKPFEAVAASFGPSINKAEDNPMSLEAIAKSLDCEKSADEAVILSTIATLKELVSDVDPLREENTKLKAELDAAKKTDPVKDRELRLSQFPADYWDKSRQLLEMKINALSDRQTPAVLSDIKTRFLSDQSLQLSALDASYGKVVDGVLTALAKAEPLRLGEATGPQTLKLSDDLKGDDQKNWDRFWEDRIKANHGGQLATQ